MATATDFLDRVLDPVSDCFTPAMAERLLRIEVDTATQARIDDLADKCTEGELTAEERAEYEMYVRVGELIAVLRAKAQSFLRESAGG
jgi:hypothetical protein